MMSDSKSGPTRATRAFSDPQQVKLLAGQSPPYFGKGATWFGLVLVGQKAIAISAGSTGRVKHRRMAGQAACSERISVPCPGHAVTRMIAGRVQVVY